VLGVKKLLSTKSMVAKERELISKARSSHMSKSFIVLSPVTDDLNPFSNLRPEPDIFKTSIQMDKDKLL